MGNKGSRLACLADRTGRRDKGTEAPRVRDSGGGQHHWVLWPVAPTPIGPSLLPASLPDSALLGFAPAKERGPVTLLTPGPTLLRLPVSLLFPPQSLRRGLGINGLSPWKGGEPAEGPASGRMRR